MLKLLKYEFRKAQSTFLALLGMTAALEAYFLISLKLRRTGHVAASVSLLMLCAMAVAAFVFIRGITSYSGELKNRSSYLIFMMPNSALKIVASKFLYTFVNGLALAALYACLAAFDLGMVGVEYYDYKSLFSGIQSLLRSAGVYVDQMLYGALFIALYTFLSMLSTIAEAYFAITLSHTLFRDKKWRWMPSLALFLALAYGVSRLCGLFPSALDRLVVIDDGAYEHHFEIASDAFRQVVLPSLLPTAGVSLAVIVASMFGCAALLERKVSL